MIKKIIHPTDKKEMMRLSCDKCRSSAASEHFPARMEKPVIAKWGRDHGWGSKRNDSGRHEDWCPICERLTKAPASYYERLSA